MVGEGPPSGNEFPHVHTQINSIETICMLTVDQSVTRYCLYIPSIVYKHALHTPTTYPGNLITCVYGRNKAI